MSPILDLVLSIALPSVVAAIGLLWTKVTGRAADSDKIRQVAEDVAEGVVEALADGKITADEALGLVRSHLLGNVGSRLVATGSATKSRSGAAMDDTDEVKTIAARSLLKAVGKKENAIGALAQGVGSVLGTNNQNLGDALGVPDGPVNDVLDVAGKLGRLATARNPLLAALTLAK